MISVRAYVIYEGVIPLDYDTDVTWHRTNPVRHPKRMKENFYGFTNLNLVSVWRRPLHLGSTTSGNPLLKFLDPPLIL